VSKQIYAWIVAATLAAPVLAAPAHAGSYVIKAVKESQPGHWILLGLHWVEGLQEIEVKLATDKDLSAIGTFIRAYFYDQDKNLLIKYENPPAAGFKTPDGEVTLFAKPGKFTKNKVETLYFPITDEIAGKWKSVVAVFGDSKQATARVYPDGKLADYEFDEKKLVK
jgi:hypothetical protein